MMEEEFNIFKNIEELRRSNLLDKLKSVQSAESVNHDESQDLENDDLSFDTFLHSNNIKSPSKRMLNAEKNKAVKKKLQKETKKSRRSSISSNGSISPILPLIENLNNKVEELPVSRRTRRSLGSCPQIADVILQNINPSSSSKGKSRGKAKVIDEGRGRGRGRGRGSNKGGGNVSASVSSIDSATDLNDSSGNLIQLSSNEESEQEEESSNQASLTVPVMERFMQQNNSGQSRVMRARRQYLAEIAARSTNVDYIDLVSSPMPRVEGFIDLASHTEKPMRITRSKKKGQSFSFNSKKGVSKKVATNSTLENSFDEDNPEINIKVNWKGKLEAFKLRKHQKFSNIFELLAQRENIGMENIVLNLNDRIITVDDTPDSIKYKIFHFIDGRILDNFITSPRGVPKNRDANNITLKIQSDKWKRPLQINIMKTDKFRILYIKCAEEIKVGVDQLKLSFDGELLEPNDTPTDLDLEGGEAIDLHIIE